MERLSEQKEEIVALISIFIKKVAAIVLEEKT